MSCGTETALRAKRPEDGQDHGPLELTVVRQEYRMLGKCVVLGLSLAVSVVYSQPGDRVDLGRLKTGAAVSFVRAAGGEWGIHISGGAAPQLTQMKPAQIEVIGPEGNIHELAAGYKTVQQSASDIDARAEIAYGEDGVFRVQDRWSLNGAVVPSAGMWKLWGTLRAVQFVCRVFGRSFRALDDVNCLAPGALYGDPTYNGDRSPGGTLNYAARRFLMREDILPAPLFALSFSNGSSVAMLDPSPRGESTVEETKLLSDVMTDERFQFGALGAWQAPERPNRVRFPVSGYGKPSTPSALTHRRNRDGSGVSIRSLRASLTAMSKVSVRD